MEEADRKDGSPGRPDRLCAGPGSLRTVKGRVAVPDARSSLLRLRELLERSGAEISCVEETALAFRSPLSPSLDVPFPAREEFGPAPVQVSRVVVDAPGTGDEALVFELSVADAGDLALFWTLFLAPFFVVGPALLASTRSVLPWLAMAAGIAGNVVNWVSFCRLRSRLEAEFRALVVAAAAGPPRD